MNKNNLQSVMRCEQPCEGAKQGLDSGSEASIEAQKGGEGVAVGAGGAVCLNPVLADGICGQRGLRPEPLVARVLGVHKRRLVTTRQQKLVKETDWTLERNVVNYTPSGLEKLLVALGMAGAVLAWPDAGDGEVAGGSEANAGGASDGEGEAIAGRWPWPRLTAEEVGAAVDQVELPQELRVHRILFNPHLLEAAKVGGEVVRVRVASNANFIPGMMLRARPPTKGGAQVWDLVGHCPRWRGRY